MRAVLSFVCDAIIAVLATIGLVALAGLFGVI
jgi:hypothetical protein